MRRRGGARRRHDVHGSAPTFGRRARSTGFHRNLRHLLRAGRAPIHRRSLYGEVVADGEGHREQRPVTYYDLVGGQGHERHRRLRRLNKLFCRQLVRESRILGLPQRQGRRQRAHGRPHRGPSGRLQHIELLIDSLQAREDIGLPFLGDCRQKLRLVFGPGIGLSPPRIPATSGQRTTHGYQHLLALRLLWLPLGRLAAKLAPSRNGCARAPACEDSSYAQRTA
mmetsp:Transcript_93496/g.269220  ORF Transcript_93496/g.269220 Transcript_93496/m.269220 type:complete len:224 (-) Transcript_93496:154-825(-)